MQYPDRIKYSVAASVIVHVMLLTTAGYQMQSREIGVVPRSTPIVLNLRPIPEREEIVEDEEPREQKRLIDPGAPADEAVTETDLISSQDSKAASNKASEGDPDKPAVDRVDDFDELGGQPRPEQPPMRVASIPPAQPVAPEVEQDLEPIEPSESKPTVPDDTGALKIAAVAPAQPTPVPAPKAEPEKKAERVLKEEKSEPTQLAQAMPQSPPPLQEFKATRGREDGGAEPGGFSSFEAKQHELGAYMLEVRKHVEREWRTALATRYAGVGPAKALLDCSIRPDGTLEYVRIVDGGNSAGFATLCKAAVERASRNFKPFPFEVPEIYRSKNLEVRWQFTYM